MTTPRIGFGGDRQIAVDVLDFLLAEGTRPHCLLVSSPPRASHRDELAARLPDVPVLEGEGFRSEAARELLAGLDLDYLICVHLPYLVPPEVLAIPRIGALNLHPSYLPYCRGWHPATWAILEGAPFGATLHFMDAGIDTGDIVHQRRLPVRPHDTADSLFRRALALERQVFEEAWPLLASGDPPRHPQPDDVGSYHARRDLAASGVQELGLGEERLVVEVVDRLRALTTNDPTESVWFERDSERYRIRVTIERVDRGGEGDR